MSELADLLRLARQAYESGELALCKSHLDRAAALDDEAPGLLRWRARMAHREGDWQALHKSASAYCAADPGDREMMQFLARAASNLRLWPAAAQAWSDLAKLRPDWPEARFQLARAQIRSNFVSAAAATIAELEAMGERDPTAWLLSGRLAVETGNLAHAVEMFSRLARDDASKAEAELGAYQRSRDARGAAAVAAALRQVAPSPERAEFIAAMALELTKAAAAHERDGNPVEAYGDFAAIAVATGNDALAGAAMNRILQSFHSQAKRFITQEEPRKAIQSYQSVLRCVPGNERALAGIGRLYMAMQDWAAAADAWRAMLDAVPRDREALLQHARASERAQDFPRALQAWRALKAEIPSSEDADEALAKLPTRIVRAGRKAVEEQRYVDAARIFALVPEDSPERADALRRLDQVARHLLREMRAAYKERKFAHVVSLGGAAAAIAPDTAEIQRLLAQAAMTGRNYAIAARAWTRLLQLSPEAASGHALQLARCYLRMGKMQDSHAVLSALLAREPDNAEAKSLARQLDSEAGAAARSDAAASFPGESDDVLR